MEREQIILKLYGNKDLIWKTLKTLGEIDLIRKGGINSNNSYVITKLYSIDVSKLLNNCNKNNINAYITRINYKRNYIETIVYDKETYLEITKTTLQ